MNDRTALLAQALSAHRAGDLTTAEPIYAQLLESDPDDAEILHLSAVIRLQKGRAEQALPLAERAVACDPAPAKPWNTLGSCRAALGDVDGAITAFESAVQCEPDFVAARANLANQLHAKGAVAEAEAHLRQVLKQTPDDAAQHNNLGSVLHAQGKGDEAEQHFRRALDLAPTLPEARLNLGIRARETGDVGLARSMLAGGGNPAIQLLHDTALPAIVGSEAEIDSLRRDYAAALDRFAASGAVIADPLRDLGQLPQFYLGYHGRDDRALQEKLASALLRATPSLGFTAAHCRPGHWHPGKTLKIGVVSRHLYAHTIGKLTQGLIRGLGAAGMESYAFFLGARDDAMTRAIAAGVDHARRLPSDLNRARALIAEAQLDVLFFPDIGMEPISYFLAFARLAPLQMVTWGHPVTTGLPNMDVFVSARDIEPAAAQTHYSERLVLLDRAALVYPRPPVVAPLDRRRLGIAPDQPLLVCPQSLFKLHPGFDPLIATVLRRLPRARLVLIDTRAAWRRQLEQRFQTTMADVAPQVVFVPRLSEADFIGLCAAADCMLDVPHWAGGNTTLEALASGTPVVTLPGTFMRGRFTAGLLDRAGLDDLIAADAVAYADKVAQVVDAARAWREKVLCRVPALYDHQQSARDFAALVHAEVEFAQKQH